MTGTVSQMLRNGDLITIDEIEIPHGDTEALCKEFLRRWGHTGGKVTPQGTIEGGQPLYVYGDAAGNSRTTKTTATDYDIIKRELRGAFPRGFALRVPDANPPVKDRVNSVNAKLKNGLGVASWWIAPRCKGLIKDLSRVRWRDGTTELDKKSDPTLTHLSDGIGYLIHWEFPIKPKADYTSGAISSGPRLSSGGHGYDYDS
ncbi:hypothetical protein D3C86_1650270 [compost metagenome]